MKTKWEYQWKIVETPQADTQLIKSALDEMGKVGWEALNIDHQSTIWQQGGKQIKGILIYFKRPVEEALPLP